MSCIINPSAEARDSIAAWSVATRLPSRQHTLATACRTDFKNQPRSVFLLCVSPRSDELCALPLIPQPSEVHCNDWRTWDLRVRPCHPLCKCECGGVLYFRLLVCDYEPTINICVIFLRSVKSGEKEEKKSPCYWRVRNGGLQGK